jgi:DNA-binding GntR family transcriptional regulator
VIASEYNLHITSITHTVSAVAATAQQALLLGIPNGAPLLKVQTHTFVNYTTAIEHTVSFYRSDRYEFSTTHTLDT